MATSSEEGAANASPRPGIVAKDADVSRISSIAVFIGKPIHCRIDLTKDRAKMLDEDEAFAGRDRPRHGMEDGRLYICDIDDSLQMLLSSRLSKYVVLSSSTGKGDRDIDVYRPVFVTDEHLSFLADSPANILGYPNAAKES